LEIQNRSATAGTTLLVYVEPKYKIERAAHSG
jgi:hypothetical protein